MNILFCLVLQLLSAQQIDNPNCSNSLFKKNKSNKVSNAEKKIIIPIHWIEITQDIKFVNSISSNLGKDLAYLKTNNSKLSLKRYITQFDSLIISLKNMKVITETEELVENEYCYLLHTKSVFIKMNNFLINNETSVAINKVLNYISENKKADHFEMKR